MLKGKPIENHSLIIIFCLGDATCLLAFRSQRFSFRLGMFVLLRVTRMEFESIVIDILSPSHRLRTILYKFMYSYIIILVLFVENFITNLTHSIIMGFKKIMNLDYEMEEGTGISRLTRVTRSPLLSG